MVVVGGLLGPSVAVGWEAVGAHGALPVGTRHETGL